MNQQEIFISCQNLWKVYGDQPKAMLEQHNYQPTDEQLADADHLAAVNKKAKHWWSWGFLARANRPCSAASPA